jgi:hypothetical protein
MAQPPLKNWWMGKFVVQRAGIVGIGRSIAEATRDLAGKLAIIGRTQQSSPDVQRHEEVICGEASQRLALAELMSRYGVRGVPARRR